ncbi:putative disease resistance protein At3g14460 [Carya illinoinensis]|nr:putative disease resistance protein At3g14460 [Carya illinoinensis]XP_042956430.1 putative disease resistance protein At3g14460 [Carya illinoinensis]KAG6682860.1 hypothetical protein I3842_13G163300 [Carya illinoinensis]
MPKLEKWFAFGAENEGVAFTHLEELEIVNCPKLTGELPIHPPLTRLMIEECPMLVTSLLKEEFPTGLQKLSIGGFDALEFIPERLMDFNTRLEELKISDCNSLISLSSGGLPSPLKVLEIKDCSKLEFPMHWNYSSLEELRLENSCDSLQSISFNLFRNLKSIKLNGCRNLVSVDVPQQLQLDLVALSSIEINNCPNFVSFPNGGLRAPKLMWFRIIDCRNLTSLPDKMHILLPSLRNLHLENCPEIESFPGGGLPSKLVGISIIDCDKLVVNRRGWELQNLPSIRGVTIKGNCKDVDSFPEVGLLPTSLLCISIENFPNMKSLDCKALRHLTRLAKLSICSCPKLKFMQEEGLPTSISILLISKCALLEKQLESKKGKAWRKIAHIPSIYINGTLI